MVKLETSWALRWEDAYAAAMYCKTCTEDKWDLARMDLFPSGAVEFADIVTADALRSMDSEQIKHMAMGYVSMGSN